jgi:hypothetical protein
MKLLILAFLITCSVQSLAQNSYDSPYSAYGVGFINGETSSLNRGLADTGIGIRDNSNLNLANPASLGAVSLPISHIFEMGTYVESNQYETSSLTASNTNGGISGMSYWFKFSRAWSGVAGIAPFSTVAYSIKSLRDLGTIENAEYLFQGDGNIARLYLGNALDLIKNLSIGLNLSYLFGSIHHYEQVNSGNLPEYNYDDKVFLNHLDLDFGLQYTINFDKKKLVIGMIANNGLRLTGNRSGRLYDVDGNTIVEFSNGTVSYTLPQAAGIGLSWETERVLIAGDMRFEKWSDASLPNRDISLQDVWRFSGGLVHKGQTNPISYLEAVAWHTGIHAGDYYQRLGAKNVINWGFSAGLSFPVFDGRSSFNLNYAFDRLGTISDGLIRQNAKKFMLDVVIRDMWGRRGRID